MPVILDNPIINSYVQGLQMRRQQEQTEFERKQKVEESGRAEKQLKGYLAHLNAEEAHQKAQLDLESQRVSTERAMHELTATKTIGEMINSGGYRPGQGPAPVNPQTTMGMQQGQSIGSDNLPINTQSVVPTGITAQPGIPSAPIKIGNMSINPDDFAGPSALLQTHLNTLRATGQVQAQNAGEQAAAVSNAEQPGKEALLGITGQNQLNVKQVETEAAAALQKTKAENDKALQKIKDDAALARTTATVTGRISAAHIGANARIEAAKLGNQVDPEIVTNNAILHATGQGGAPLGNNKQDVATKKIMSNLGYVDMSTKTAEQLKGVHAVDPLYDKMKEFIGKLPEDSAGAIGQSLMARIPTTDLNNFKKEITALSGNISKTIGGETGRLTDQDILRAMAILAQPGITKQQALDRLSFFESATRSKVMDQILGGQNDHQKLQNLETYKFDPAQFNGVVPGVKKKDGTPVNRFMQDKDGEWLVYNKKRGGYEGVDARR